MKTLTIAAALGFALVLFGCAPPTLMPTVMVDESFSEAEYSDVAAGLDAWESAAPEVRLPSHKMGHAEIIGAALEGKADTIFIVRVTSPQDRDCPTNDRLMPQGDRGYEEQDDISGSAVICIIAPSPFRRPQVVMHEVGHALGLSHAGRGTIMHESIGAYGPVGVTAADVTALRSR